MKQIRFIVTIVSVLLLGIGSTKAVHGHAAGQPPFFKIDGVYTNIYPVPSVSDAGLSIPQDIAPNNYLVGQKINFEVDWKVLGVSEEVVKLTSFRWDNGDNTRARGLTQTHAYNKPGTYIQTISALPQGIETPQLLQSTLIHIVPDASYIPPVPRIIANGSIVNNPSQDIIYADLSKPIHFEVTSNGSSPIKRVQWDFGDGKTGEGSKIVHQYPVAAVVGGLSMVQTVARVTDTKDFFSDTFIMIYDKSLLTTPAPQPDSVGRVLMPNSATGIRLGLLCIVAISIIGIYLRVFRK